MGMLHLWLLMLCVSSCSAAPVSESLVVSVSSPGSVHSGRTVVLPCWLDPPQNAEALEVRWYHGSDHFDNPILHLKANKFMDTSKEASYVGRVSFGVKDGTSGGLKAGDVSLKLTNVSVQDVGNYTCYVSSDQGYDSGTVSLLVTETGSNPLLSVVWKEDNMINVTCTSEGWYPKPVMRWSDDRKNPAEKHVVYHQDPAGLHSVHGWVFIPSSTEVSCSVGLPNEEAKEARLHLGNPEKQEKSDKGWAAFGVLFAIIAIALALLGFMYMKKRGRKSKREPNTTEEQEPMIPPVISATVPTVPQKYDPSSFSENYVNITVEDTGNKYVMVKDTKIRDDNRPDFPDGDEVTCVTAVKGTSGFSSGKHYWEVSLSLPNIEPKKSWWVGVTSASEIPVEADFTPNTSNGFWFLSSSPQFDHFQISTSPFSVSLPFNVRPHTVGVCLDCNSGELSFYDVENKSLIASLTATFTGEVFPLFNPGKGDQSPMKILHKSEQTQGVSEPTNGVDPTKQPNDQEAAETNPP